MQRVERSAHEAGGQTQWDERRMTCEATQIKTRPKTREKKREQKHERIG